MIDYYLFRKEYSVSLNSSHCINVTILRDQVVTGSVAGRYSVELIDTHTTPRLTVHRIPIVIYIENIDSKFDSKNAEL